ncbi:phosphotransferase [Deinococcus sp.]|uniref:phosphotransferase n=1 Tax=Deinococcus sp. TaxID=47478 RepID=UPI003CC62F0E
MDDPEHRIGQFLRGAGLAQAGEDLRCTPLTGGVSSDIWRVEIGQAGRTICVKRALPRLRVEAEWHAPLSRNAYEWAWLAFASRALPRSCPQPLAHDAERGMLAMAYLPPEDYSVWKSLLMRGEVDPHTARAVGERLGHLHAASTLDPALPERFHSDDNFYALRLEPYLLATARVHPDLASRLGALAERTAQTRLALVHGDVSPKNILVGAGGPVFLDAECAWFGDPAFDLAFCLTHLLLKLRHLPASQRALEQSFSALHTAYLSEVTWEAPSDLEERAAALLPALLLARVDGKSPVEYLNGEQRAGVRHSTAALIRHPASTLPAVMQRWQTG